MNITALCWTNYRVVTPFLNDLTCLDGVTC